MTDFDNFASVTHFRTVKASSRIHASDVLEAAYAAVEYGIENDNTPQGRAIGRVMAALLCLPFDGIAAEVAGLVNADRAGAL
jgi:hypothetical protein